MSDMQINQVLAQMRILAQQAGLQETAAPRNPGTSDFAGLLRDSIGKVNEVQNTASTLRTSFERGDPNVSLAQVMVAGQKSSIAFEATVQVRNKLLEAYKEVMSMPV